jgi:competence protein ComEC
MRLPGALLSYISGLLIAPYLYLPSSLLLLIFISTGALLVCRSKRLTVCTLILFFFCVGLFQYKISITPPSGTQSIHSLSDQGPIVLAGVIDTIHARYPQGANCTVEIDASFENGIKTTQVGKIRLTIDQLNNQLSPGNYIRFRTQLRTPREFGVPGEFNYPRHLAEQRIFTTGFIKNSRDIVKLMSTDTLNPIYILRRWSQRIAESIEASVSPDIAPYLRGLATGDRGALSPEQREQLARSGISHLFAISGLHLGIIASTLYLLFVAAYRRSLPLLYFSPPRRILPIIILLFVTAYMLFTGGAISTLRALLCLIAVTVAFLLRRHVAPLQLLASAAFIILLFNPLAIFTPGFQLSFAGATGILCISKRWANFCQDRPKILTYPATLFVVTLAATFSTLPLVLLHFHVFAPAGLIMNMIAVPAVTLLAVPLCLTGIVATAFSPEIATFAFNLAAFVLDMTLNIATTLLERPGFSAQYIYLPTQMLIGSGIFVLTIMIPMKPRIRTIGLFLATIILLSPLLPWKSPQPLNVTAISVGQGDSTLVTTSNGETFLVDGGGFSHSSYDTGERLVAPTLGYMGIQTIDTVVLSHNHPDHQNGLQHILKHFTVHNFWSSTAPENLNDSLKKILSERNIPIHTFGENWSVVEQNHNSKIAVYRVPDNPISQNNQSLVLYFQNGSDGLLLTGDLEIEGITQLSNHPPPGPVTLLKVPHHGSRYSNPQKLIDRFNPRIAYISVGNSNRYGQPHDEVLKLLKHRPLQLLRTDQSGSLDFKTYGDRWAVRQWEKGLFH